MTEAVPNYSELHREVQRQLVEARQRMQDVIKSVFADFFRKYPDVYGIGWVQYTPSWNDGESCEFSVHEVNLYLTEDAYDEGDSDNDIFDGSWRRSGLSADEQARVDAVGGEQRLREIIAHFEPVADFIEQMEDADMQLIFGNGSRILATKDDLTVEDYSDEGHY